jgi:hypothetical protein
VRALLPGSRDRGPAQTRRERQAAARGGGARGRVRPSDGVAAHSRRCPRSGGRRHRPTSRHDGHGERSERRPRQPDLIGQDTR